MDTTLVCFCNGPVAHVTNHYYSSWGPIKQYSKTIFTQAGAIALGVNIWPRGILSLCAHEIMTTLLGIEPSHSCCRHRTITLTCTVDLRLTRYIAVQLKVSSLIYFEHHYCLKPRVTML